MLEQNLYQTDVANIPVAANLNPAISERQIAICVGDNCKDNHPNQGLMSYEHFVECFCEVDTRRGTLPLEQYLALDKTDKQQSHVRSMEKDGEYFIPAKFARKNTRLAEDVVALSCFVMDIDTGNVHSEDIQSKLDGLTYFAYTSYSHHPDCPRWRVVIPYAKDISPEIHQFVYQHFQGFFDGNLDKRCATVNQIWYTPACPPDAAQYFQFIENDGEWFEPESLIPKDMCVAITKKPSSCQLREITSFDTDVIRIESALEFIPADDYQQWIKMGLALFNSIGEMGRDIWLRWSEKSPKFDLQEANEVWKSFKSSNSGSQVKLGTLFLIATGYGWTDGGVDTPEYVLDMNKNHFVAIDGGKTFVFIEEHHQPSKQVKLTHLSVSSFKDYYRNQKMEFATDAGTTRKNLGTLWLDHPRRRTYNGLMFSPSGKVSTGYYNTWTGFAYEPVQGDWSKFKQHIHQIICNGNDEDYEYLLNWMAFAVQKPYEPAKVAVVLKGERGTGKGTLINIFKEIFGQHSLQITSPKHLVGNFNAHLANCVFLFADEAFYAGDKQGEAVLKGLITENTFTLERKGMDAISSPNYLHIMMASNSEWVVPAGTSERRFFVLNVAQNQMQNRAYFEEVRTEMYERKGIKAMLYDLLHRDVSAFDIFKFRRNSALDEQIIHSMTREEEWWMERLGMLVKNDKTWREQSREELHNSYQGAVSTYHERGSATKLGLFLKKHLPDGFPKKINKRNTDGKIDNYYELPTQEVCRQFFMNKKGLQENHWE